MFNQTKIPSSYETGSQSPLDSKGKFFDLDDMKNTSNYRPLYWFKNMDCIDVSTGVKYIWKESINGVIDGGYLYPDNVESFGIVYSNKIYNFVESKISERLESFKVIGTSIGKVQDGEIMPEHSSNDERWKYVGQNQILPTFNLPIANLTPSVSPNNSTEVGTVFTNINFVASLTKNDGGDATNYRILKDNVDILNDSNISQKLDTFEVGTTPIIFKAVISYSEGTTHKDDNLEPPNSIPNPISAGTDDSPVISYRGYRAVFYGDTVSKNTTSTQVRATLTKRLENSGNVFNLNTGSDNIIFQIWLPTGKNLVSVIDLDALNANITSSYVSSSLVVNDIKGNPIAGTLYTMEQGVPYSSNHRHQITIS